MAGEYHGFGIKFPTKCILLQATVPVSSARSTSGAKREFSEALFRENQPVPARVSRSACYPGQERQSVR